MPVEPVSDSGRKSMPSITMYNSDDSIDDGDLSSSLEQNGSSEVGDEDDRPLSEIRLSSKEDRNGSPSPVDKTNIKVLLPHLSPSSSSSSSSNELAGAESELNELVERFSNLPVVELLSSKRFAVFRKHQKLRQDNTKTPLSAYTLFFQETLPTTKAEKPNTNFGGLAHIINEKWSALTRDEKTNYAERASSVDGESTLQTLLTYKTRLLNLNSTIQRQCINPDCSNPTIPDPRWNGQYCSTACVSQHCRLAFSNWFSQKQTAGSDTRSAAGSEVSCSPSLIDSIQAPPLVTVKPEAPTEETRCDSGDGHSTALHVKNEPESPPAPRVPGFHVKGASSKSPVASGVCVRDASGYPNAIELSNRDQMGTVAVVDDPLPMMGRKSLFESIQTSVSLGVPFPQT